MRQTIASDLAITGIGCISGFGLGADALERGLFDGRTTIAPVQRFDTSHAASHLAGFLPDFDPAAFIHPARLRRIDSVGRLAVACCRLTLEDAGLIPAAGGSDQIGVALGSDTAGLHSLVDFLDRLIAHGPAGASALDFSNTVGNAAASLCAIELGLRGPNVTLNYREASALSAVAHAANMVRLRRSQAIVTGGVDDFESVFFAVHDQFGALATDDGSGEASRPFDRRRNGFVLGTGAFMLVLEDGDAARARQAPWLGSIAGAGATASRCRMNAWPDDPTQLARCMRQAIDEAGLTPREIDVVFAAANSTRQLDRVEAQALAAVFGPSGVPVVAVKGALGESGAGGAAGLVAAVLSLKRREIPPTVGFEEVDPECPVDVAPAVRPLRPGRTPAALVNAFASGGANYSMVVRA